MQNKLALNPKYILLEPLTGVSAWRDGGDMLLRVLASDEAESGLPYGYAHDESLAAAFLIRPNMEGDESFNARRWQSISFKTELDAAKSWKVRIRFQAAGWAPSHTEWWQELEMPAGTNEVHADMSDFVMCMDSGMLACIRFDVLEAAPGTTLRITAVTPCEHDGASYWAPRIDRFGQRLNGDWQDKVQSESDLEADAQAPLPKALDAGNRDQWGGWTDGPSFEAKGSFGIEQDDGGAWWLVTPDGNPYLSLGACCTGVGSVGIEVPGRESWFEQLPAKDGDLSDAWRADPPSGFAGAELYPRKWHGHAEPKDPEVTQCSFFVANLIRSFGPDWYEKWCDRTAARLDAWGMTSLGCWSDIEFAESHQRPTVMPAERLSDPGWEELLARGDSVWPVKTVPDVFDPRFEKIAEGCFAGLEQFRGKPWVLGFFVGNEQKWSFLGSPMAMPLHWESRRVFIDGLKEKHGSIRALNEAWSTGFVSWERLAAEQTNEHPPGLSEQGVADCDAFLETFCDRYFGAVREELKRAVPDALFWGCRYLALPPRAAVLRGSAKHMDIVSINWYLWHKQEPEDAETFLGRWHELCGGKPLAMTEWSFEVTNERLLASRILTTTEQERAEQSKRYMDACFKLPFVVGLHWFQWPDQPILGRGKRNGERSAFGILDVADRPHKELTEAITESASRMYAMHGKG